MDEQVSIGHLRISQEDKGYIEHKLYAIIYIDALNNALKI